MPFRFFTQNVMFGWCEVKKKEISRVFLVNFFGFKLMQIKIQWQEQFERYKQGF